MTMLINPFEIQVFQITNRVRQKSGLRPLVLNNQLIAAARFHSQDMARMRIMGHQGSNGSQVTHRARRFGYPFSFVGENVAAGQRTPKEVMTSWINSPGHYRNLLLPDYSEIGVGYISCRSGYKTYWTQVFGHR